MFDQQSDNQLSIILILSVIIISLFVHVVNLLNGTFQKHKYTVIPYYIYIYIYNLIILQIAHHYTNINIINSIKELASYPQYI